MKNKISKLAVIDKTVTLGNNVTIGPYSIVHPNVRIDDNTSIESHCIIYPDTIIGKNNKIYDHVIIGADPQDLNFDTNIKTSVKILDNNIIREFVTIHRSTKEEKPTQIYSNSMIMVNCHIAHDCIVGDNVIMSNTSILGGHAMIEEFAVLGGNTLVHQHVRVGKLSMTAGGTRIVKDVIPYMLVGRDPVKHYCLNKVGIKRYGVSNEDYKVLDKAFRLLRKGKDITKLTPMTEDLQYLISWFSVKSERGNLSFI
ncbi:MAG: acyl-ACP--UDP-N-acetylglucosamine O-acyltransferase [Gammaproteobacteria bacterium]